MSLRALFGRVMTASMKHRALSGSVMTASKDVSRTRGSVSTASRVLARSRGGCFSGRDASRVRAEADNQVLTAFCIRETADDAVTRRL
jgi:hypothetical protein